MANIQSDHKYKFVNAKAGNVADLSGGDNKSVIGYDDHNAENQHWWAVQEDNGWTFRNVSTGRYLGVEGIAGDGTPVVAIDSPFQWHVWPDEEDPSAVRLFVPNTNKNIDLSDHGNPAPGTLVTLWTKWHPGRNQLWYIQEV